MRYIALMCCVLCLASCGRMSPPEAPEDAVYPHTYTVTP